MLREYLHDKLFSYKERIGRYIDKVERGHKCEYGAGQQVQHSYPCNGDVCPSKEASVRYHACGTYTEVVYECEICGNQVSDWYPEEPPL